MSDYAKYGRSSFLSEGLSWEETRRDFQEKECPATMGHFTIANVPRHIRIDHPKRELFYCQGKKSFAPRSTYEYDGKEYHGAKALADAMGVVEDHVHNLIKDGAFRGLPIKKKTKGQQNIRVKWNGEEYESIKDFADVHQLSLDSAKAMICRGFLLHGFPVERIKNE